MAAKNAKRATKCDPIRVTSEYGLLAQLQDIAFLGYEEDCLKFCKQIANELGNV